MLGKGEVDLFSDCGGKQYWSSVMPLDGCTNLYSWPSTASFRVNHVSSLDAQIEPSVAWNVGQTMQTGSPEKAQKKYRVRCPPSSLPPPCKCLHTAAGAQLRCKSSEYRGL